MPKKQQKAGYVRVLLRGLTVPGAGVCDVGDLVSREFVPAELWDMVAAGEHPHMAVHDGPVSEDRIREHRPRGIMAIANAPPPTPLRRQPVGQVVGVGEVRAVESASVKPEQDLADLVYEDIPEAIE